MPKAWRESYLDAENAHKFCSLFEVGWGVKVKLWNSLYWFVPQRMFQGHRSGSAVDLSTASLFVQSISSVFKISCSNCILCAIHLEWIHCCGNQIYFTQQHYVHGHEPLDARPQQAIQVCPLLPTRNPVDRGRLGAEPPSHRLLRLAGFSKWRL